MSEESNAGGEAGPVTPVKAPAPDGRDALPERATAPDPFPSFKCDERRLKAVRSLHKTAQAIARTQAWESVMKAALRPLLVAGVLVVAMACGVQVPWEWGLAAILGGAVMPKA